MASIYKRKQDRGKKRCPWYIGYTNHTGKRRTVKGFTDRGESERLAVRLEDDARLIRQGLKEPVQERLCQARREPIERHVELFEKHLQSRDVTPKQVDETVARLRKLVADQHLQTLADLDATVVETFLANLRGRGAASKRRTTT